MKEIKGFFGEYRWLSNFYRHDVTFEGVVYPSSENAYQAAKCANIEDRSKFLDISASSAKQLGRQVKIRSDWDTIKVDIMWEILEDKFKAGSEPAQKLIDTKDAYLEETNNWGDQFWGVSKGKGENMLGKILMEIRDQYLK